MTDARAAAPTATCRHCGRAIELKPFVRTNAWLADVPFTRGMLACMLGDGRRHEPTGRPS